ncbi:hypothetical protein [Nocardia lijiangensis]|uniref:hypothetical protein n=1 Tax=Nocardia lijiangensis TaxID=299618 RepID=UPI00082B23A5|nr:hypothetical protein [Nocardia lijiangensis]
MAAPHASQHAAGFTRLLGVLTLIAGIAAMHVGIFTTPAAAAHHATAVAADPFAAVTVHHAAAISDTGAHPAPTSDHWAEGNRTSADHSAATADSADVGGDSAAQAAIVGNAPASGSADHLAVRALTHSEFLLSPSAEPRCADCGDGHAGLHACVFILTVLTMAVLLVVLYRIAGDHHTRGPTPRHWRPERERPPPWTVLSLAELSILRI